MGQIDHLAETRRVLDEVEGAEFDPVGWTEIDAAAQQLEMALEREDLLAIRASTTLLGQALFEARVRGRFTRDLRGSPPPIVLPAKRSSSLPLVGIVCGIPILAIGWLLGGGIVLAFAIAFELLVLVVAVAGSRVAHRAPDPDEGAEPARPAPAPVAERLARIGGLLAE